MAVFAIDEALARVAVAVAPYPPAALFELADRGHRSTFEQLVACLISVRTRDEVMLPAALRLFAVARTPADMAELSVATIDELITPAAFHSRKASQIRDIARAARDRFDGALPCDDAALQSLAGIGPKCAHLVLGIACDTPYIGVDVHVHRITNRWGYVATNTPEKTMAALEAKLPRRYWVDINRWLVPFGKHICQARRPRCDACPLRDMCPRVGVAA